MLDEYMPAILKNKLFQGIEKSGAEAMLGCLRPEIKYVPKSDYIASAGNLFSGLGIILSGEAVVSKENAAGDRVVMTHLEPGEMFGEMIAFSSQKEWPVNVQALTDCNAMFLSRDKIVRSCGNACSWHQAMIMNLMCIISERAIQLNKKLDYLSIKSMRGKISTYLLEQQKKTGGSSFMLPMQRDELADFLNVSRPSMSREMGRMRDEGVIDFHRSAVKIVDIEALRNMVDD